MMTTYMFIGMIVGAVLGLLVAHPTMNLPVYTGFTNEKLGNMFPILFVTVACGAISGFHSLVSSDTSSKTIANEKDMLKVGYGAMVLGKPSGPLSLSALQVLLHLLTAHRLRHTGSRYSPTALQASWKCSVSRFMLPSAS